MGGGASTQVGNIETIAAFQGASESILSLMREKNETIAYSEAYDILRKYETACKTIREHFPGAKDGKIILEETIKTLKKYGVDSANTLFAQSICCDEINHEIGDISQLFSTYLGEVFHMGGLAGISAILFTFNSTNYNSS